jgi:hypothetical protein
MKLHGPEDTPVPIIVVVCAILLSTCLDYFELVSYITTGHGTSVFPSKTAVAKQAEKKA